MQHEELIAKERETANKLLDHPFLKGTPVPESLVFWAAKLASLVEGNDPRVADLYKALRDCLYRETSVTMLAPYAFVDVTRTWGLEDARELERWHNAYKNYSVDAKRSAYQAAKIAASIKGVPIDTDALVPSCRGDFHGPRVHGPATSLRKGYMIQSTTRVNEIGTLGCFSSPRLCGVRG